MGRPGLAPNLGSSGHGGYQTVALNSPFSGFGSRKGFSGGDYETSAAGGVVSTLDKPSQSEPRRRTRGNLGITAKSGAGGLISGLGFIGYYSINRGSFYQCRALQ